MAWLRHSLLALSLLWALPAQADAITTIYVQDIPLEVEVADNLIERTRGMMYREQWEPIDGMLFVFPEPHFARMWMKNTPLAMDILFIGEDGAVLSFVENAVPYSEAILDGAPETKYALELPAGFVAKHGLKKGDEIRISHSGD